MLGMAISPLVCLFVVMLRTTNAAPPPHSLTVQGDRDLTKPLVEPDVGSDAEKDIKELTNFFKKYQQYEEPPRDPSESSDDGHNGRRRQEIDVTRTPAFVERVIELQREFGMEPTGVLNKDLMEKSKTDRCGMTDAPRDPNAPAAFKVKSMWESKHDAKMGRYQLTYSFDTEDFPSRSKISKQDIKIGVLNAMCTWEKNSNIRFTKDMGDNAKNADITIGFGSLEHGDRFPFDGPGNTLAHAFYPENGRLHFDKDENWYLAGDLEQYDKRDIFTVAAHELGHNLGLEHSSVDGALMAPFYNFKGSYEKYQLPQDDIKGMRSMYGNAGSPNPEAEGNSACSHLKKLNPQPGRSTPRTRTRTTTTTPPYRPPTRRTTTPTRRTATPRTTTTFRPAGNPGCRDDEHMGGNCDLWKEMGYCKRKGQSETMTRRCRYTCGLCPVEPKNRKTGGEVTPENACNIGSFDSFTTMFDGGELFHANGYKDGYFVMTYIRLKSTSRQKKQSLLNNTAYLDKSLIWLQDPKTIKPDTYKIDGMFDKTTNKLSTVLLTRRWYLLFGDDGKVDQYSRSTSSPVHIQKHFLGTLFDGYPHDTVDSAYVEYRMGRDKRQTVHTLFRGSRMWQYEEVNYASMHDSANGRYQLKYVPIESRSDVDIASWHGVPACSVDSVFKYKDVPYFLKGNLFWPAVDSEPQVARDITYHFFRCQSGNAPRHSIPQGCQKVIGTQKQEGGNGSAAIQKLTLAHILLSLILSVFVLS